MRWLSIIGIGEDGIEGLSPAARALISGASQVIGGARHIALAGTLIKGEALAWPSPMTDALNGLRARAGTPTVVLASGDPFCYGIGSLIAAHVPADDMLVIPAPSAFSLAAARLGWALQAVRTISFCGRPIEPLAPLLQPGTRIFALSADATTPGKVAAYLRQHGFGPTRIHVLEALGGPDERLRSMTADDFDITDAGPLNMLALEVVAGPDARIIPLASGLDDDMFEHDGQITKREIRAVTLSALAPRVGELLWDIGGGSGSISIEWLLRDSRNRAIAIEPKAERAARAARNAVSLGVPHLDVRTGKAPEAFDGLPTPDAIFIGGGTTGNGVIGGAWMALRPGGRIVANSVTIETDAALTQAMQRFGGTLTRISIERLDKIGTLHGFRPAMTVTQWQAVKP
ncbi:MAG: precorrin-6y C5,15-methyltransferase (decarboxylating) subunit CbiE [Parvibaculaceae bacterium]|nr:precorrin-6y C5,15-methyltransferase (decarboxylating) subunit CbiE [Parvibaculaceae bacterium]